MKILIYNEFVHEQDVDSEASRIYPEGIHTVLKNALCDEFDVETVTLETCDQITEELLSDTDVIIWWGHLRHASVPDETARLVQQAVLGGMGMIALHSAHHSKPFQLLMGTNCHLNWREDGDRELVWVCKPSHPIAQGIGRFVKLDSEETYCEPFGIPEPEETVFIGSYEFGEVIRAGCCWKRENGRIFYFQPGHETFPTYYNKEIIRIIKNAIKWAAPDYRVKLACPNVKKPLEGLM